jgi:hypothetical protein
VLDSVDLHLIQYLGCLHQQHFDNPDMVFDVEVRREHAVAQHLVKELALRGAFVWSGLPSLGFHLSRQAQQGCVGRFKQ